MKKINLLICFISVLLVRTSAQEIGIVNSNYTMQNVILPDTKPEDWPEIRNKIKNRILANWGTPCESYESRKNKFYEYERFNKNGLVHIKIRYHVAGDMWDKAIIVLPKGFDSNKKYKGFVAVHGTNWEVGGIQMTDREFFPDRAYAYEMAMNGYVCIAPDHFGFGDTLKPPKEESQKLIFKGFFEKYPRSSIDSRQILGFIRALDVLDQLPYTEHKSYSAMGNSLGGKTTLYLAAMDERIKACVVSTGVSPFSTNVYRGLNRPRTSDAKPSLVAKTGKFPWEIQEIIALVAPRSILFLEPFNDDYNPYTSSSVTAFFLAEEVWKLLKKEVNFQFLIHGDGHNTTEPVRKYAYDWISRNY